MAVFVRSNSHTVAQINTNRRCVADQLRNYFRQCLAAQRESKKVKRKFRAQTDSLFLISLDEAVLFDGAKGRDKGGSTVKKRSG